MECKVTQGVRRAHQRHAGAAVVDDGRFRQHLPLGLPRLCIQVRTPLPDTVYSAGDGQELVMTDRQL